MPAGRTRRRTGSALGSAGFARALVLVFGLVSASLAGLVVPPPPAALAQNDEVTEPPPTGRSYTRAYVAMGTGLALTGLSFVLAETADQKYEEYLAETDPGRIEDIYQETLTADRLSAAALIAGQAALALGIYWRFLHHPGEDDERNDAPRWGVRPRFDEEHGPGLALDVRF